MNYRYHIRDLLYQFRIELSLILFELLNGWEITWIIPL